MRHNVSSPSLSRYHRPDVGGQYAARIISSSTHNNTTWLAWQSYDPESGQEHVFAQPFAGAERRQAHRLTPQAGKYDRPTIVASDGDKADCVWISNGNELFHSSLNSAGESTPVPMIREDGWLRDMSLCRDDAGVLWCAAILTSGKQDAIVLYNNRGGSWQRQTRRELPGFLARTNIAATGKNLALTYDRYIHNRYQVEVALWRDDDFDTPAVFEADGQSCLNPRLTVDNLNRFWLCFLCEQIVERDGVIGRSTSVRVARLIGGEWQNVAAPDGMDVATLHRGLLPIRRYFGYDGLRRNPRLIATDDDAIHLVWESQRGEEEEWDNVRNGYLLARAWRDGKWEEPRQWLDGGCCFGSDNAAVQPASSVACFFKAEHRVDGHDFKVAVVDTRAAPLAPREDYSAWKDWKALDLDAPAPPRAEMEANGRRFKLYFGDFHSHSIFSPDAEGYPDELYFFARDVARIEFAGITDNDFYPEKAFLSSESAYQQHLLRRLEETNTFLPFCGYEWTFHRDDADETYNHRSIVFLGDDERIVRRIEADGHTETAFKAALEEMNVFAHAHHGQYELLGAVQEANVEITSGWAVNMEVSDAAQRMLDSGHRFGFIGGGDSHRMAPGLSGALVAVWAENLSREAIAEALRERRCYATTGNRTAIDFRLNGVLMGGGASVAPGEKLNFEVHVRAERNLRSVSIIASGETLHTFDCDGRELKASWQTPAIEPAWYYLRVEDDRPYQAHPHNVAQAAGPWAWSSPVWVELSAK